MLSVSSMLPAVWTVAAAVPTAAAAGSVAYLLTLLNAAAKASRRSIVAPDATPWQRVDVIVPAHDEEEVIAATLRSLLALDYPKPLLNIVVVADNCTDRTAEIAQSFAGVTVLERVNKEQRGKGYALDWGITRRMKESEPADIFVIIDADTEAEPDFLMRLVAQVERSRDLRGRAAVQGRYGVLNSGDGWRAMLMAAAFELVNHVKPLGADALGLSVDLKGNGMGFTRETLAQARWHGRSITEDIDFGLDLLEQHGVRVGYAPDAVVRAQMPVTAAQAGSQRDRWELGRRQLMKERTGPLLQSGLFRGDVRRLEAGVRLIVPPLAELAGLCLLSVGISALGLFTGLLPFAVTWLTTALFVLAGLALYILGGLQVAGAPRAAFAALAMAPAYALWKMVRLVVTPLLRGRQSARDGEWVRTQRIATAGSTEGPTA